VETGEVQAVLRVLRARGHVVDIYKHLPRRGMAEQRQFLLEQAKASYSLFLDDDLILEPDVVERMLIAIQEEGCGFVGCALTGLSFINDVRPHEQKIEFWDGPVQPEIVKSGTPQWERWRLHNGANIYHVQQRLGLTSNRQRKYRVAWIAACVMYDTIKLRAAGGFSFWQELPPEHCGEDVLVQLRVMALYGGCGIIPSGVYHQELPTTIVDRSVAADSKLNWGLYSD
jgi:glycosyltransferase involved in cell wall biosynthesis